MFGYTWQIITVLWAYAPIWLPIVLVFIFADLWVKYARGKFAESKPKVLLEVRLPMEINKSPLAMELVLTSLYVTSRESTWVDRYIKGQSRPTFSLELVSIGGKVHFYIWTEKDFRTVIESQIYSQYPNIEIMEVEDYTKGIVYQPGVNEMFGVDFIKTGVDALPIKTYVDYGLDRDPKEEFKIDPITPALEFLGSLKQDEQVWMQFIIRAHKAEKVIYVKNSSGRTERKKVDWKHYAEEQKKKILDSLKDKTVPNSPSRRLTKSEEEVISAIDRSISKLPFDIGIRGIYFATKEGFSGTTRTGLMGSIRQYNSNNLNGLKPNSDTTTSFDYPWQDFGNMRLDAKKRKMLNRFKQRSYFTVGECKPVVMSTEELATMYHFPGGVATTPSFGRIMSKKAEAPDNLPI